MAAVFLSTAKDLPGDAAGNATGTESNSKGSCFITGSSVQPTLVTGVCYIQRYDLELVDRVREDRTQAGSLASSNVDN